MNRYRIAVALIVFTTLSVSPGLAAEPAAKTRTLIDFTRQETEWSGVEHKPVPEYEYTFESWKDKLVFVKDKGVLVPGLPGRGGMGANERLEFKGSTVAQVQVALGARNESGSLSVGMIDADGTEVIRYLPLKDKPRGVLLTYSLQLDKPDKEDKPGKKPGFDWNKTKTWQIQGDWTDSRTELFIVKLAAITP